MNAPRLVLVKPKRAVAAAAPAVIPTMRLRVVALTAAGRIGYEVDAPVVGPPAEAIRAFIADSLVPLESVTLLWVRNDPPTAPPPPFDPMAPRLVRGR